MLDRLGERRVALAVGRGEVEAELLPQQAADRAVAARRRPVRRAAPLVIERGHGLVHVLALLLQLPHEPAEQRHPPRPAAPVHDAVAVARRRADVCAVCHEYRCGAEVAARAEAVWTATRARHRPMQRRRACVGSGWGVDLGFGLAGRPLPYPTMQHPTPRPSLAGGAAPSPEALSFTERPPRRSSSSTHESCPCPAA